MELESLDILSSKVEKALHMIRTLKAEKSSLEELLALASAESAQLQARSADLATLVGSLRAELEGKDSEALSLRSVLQEKEGKIQAATARLEAVMSSLEAELGGVDTEVDSEADSYVDSDSNAEFSGDPEMLDVAGDPQSFLDFEGNTR